MPNESYDDILTMEQELAEQSIAIHVITNDNAVFARTPGGFVSLDFTDEKGETKHYARVAVHRCFPFSDPGRYISIREPDSDGREIGLIENIETVADETRVMLEEQLALRYFVPKILAIRGIREEYGYSYWHVKTDRGECRFTVRIGGGSFFAIGTNRYLAVDIDGNRFEIPDITRMTPKELKRLDLYI